ncbi:hypothetical protein [Planctomicrobium sp. SH527]|uniref:hypothetical protein n=1 Tax=Planctomicrobium sp. SH527 TaxID=3448123 RepID=UPI003F5BE797
MVKYRPIIVGSGNRHKMTFPLFDSQEEARKAVTKFLQKLSSMEQQYTGVRFEVVEEASESEEDFTAK